MSQGSHQIQTQAQQLLQTLSPQQILVVKLLELPTMELEERVRAEILDNPALEEGREPSEQDHADELDTDFSEENLYTNEDISLGDYRTEDDIPDYKLQEHNRSKGEVPEEIPFSDSVSFYEMLLEQLRMQHLTEEEETIAEYLIGSLDDDGMLRKGPDTLINELILYRGIYIDAKEIERILSIIQDFDPAGIGARSLQECLLLQLKRKPNTPLKKIEVEIIEKCCDDFTRKNKEKIKSRILRRTVAKILDYLRVVVFGVLIDVLGLAFPWYAIPYAALVVTLGILLIEGKSVIENYQKARSSAAKVVDMIQTIVECGDNDTAEKIIKAIKADSANHKKPKA
jgi:RNA polymerase sigma-54 factor